MPHHQGIQRAAVYGQSLSKDTIQSPNHERYQEEGVSKAKRVRSLLKQVDCETALRVLSALWQYKIESLPE